MFQAMGKIRFVFCFVLLLLWGGRPGYAKAPGDSTALPPFLPLHAALPELLAFSGPTVHPDSASCIIPFSRAGNLILIKARADTTEGNFILDTGASDLVLNITYFRHYPKTHTSGQTQTNATGSSQSVIKTEVRKLNFGTLKFVRAKADLVNLGHLENSKGVKILGLLGMALFRQCEMIIDYERNLIFLHVVSKKEANTYKSDQLQDSSAYREVPIYFKEDKLVTRTELAGRKLEFIIDSGAETNLLDSRLPDKVFDNVTVTGRIMLTGTGNRKVEALQGLLENLMIGRQNVQNMQVIITNFERTCFSYSGCVNGVLGFDFLSRQKIGFNFVKNKMYLWK
ncbi:hypothetical protein EFA69_18020 [Rufibacter immobilis]|uniref:Peptidase A2 domain-containing protein n=1 Tax=Rufibacter immobilis TaxID=1348778 RepID=A0A3M9MSU3_9BACT|nr:aspartyl protease family protein [Rufibacter immobilis]RNI27983.1 hypothetical protein EFA69_18020 [Rufibacter immobilis]